jgi:hypothetical protein
MIAEQMANWLIGSILFALGVLVLVFMCVLINNLLHKYWKPITVVFFRNESLYPKMRFTAAEDTVNEPTFESQKPVDKTKD